MCVRLRTDRFYLDYLMFIWVYAGLFMQRSEHVEHKPGVLMGSYWGPSEEPLGPWFRLAWDLLWPHRGPAGVLLGPCWGLGWSGWEQLSACLHPPDWLSRWDWISSQSQREDSRRLLTQWVSVEPTWACVGIEPATSSVMLIWVQNNGMWILLNLSWIYSLLKAKKNPPKPEQK